MVFKRIIKYLVFCDKCGDHIIVEVDGLDDLDMAKGEIMALGWYTPIVGHQAICPACRRKTKEKE